MRWRLAVSIVLAAAVVSALPGRAEAAGVVTHAWMAEAAIERVHDHALADLLRAQLPQLRAGAQFPDGGYITRARGVPGGDYGEEAHWARFQAAYLETIRERRDCGDLTRPEGPCAAEVAHLLGVAAHGLGDQVWDWLFEPNGPDHAESFIPPELAGVIGPGGLETQMDVVALVEHGRSATPAPPEPSVDDLVAAFARAGRPDITADALRQGREGLATLQTLEGANAPKYHAALVAAMPWTSANMVSAPGGVDFAARVIAGTYEDLWARLQGRSPVTRVVAVAPIDGATDVPATGWVRSYQPGSGPGGGGARTRIAAVLSHPLTYVPDARDRDHHVPAELPPGTVTLVDDATGVPVPLAPGYPRIVPYDPDPGENEVAVEPAADLEACRGYRVEVTERLRDAEGRAAQPFGWSFRTDCSRGPAAGAVAPAHAAPASAAVPVAAAPVFAG